MSPTDSHAGRRSGVAVAASTAALGVVSLATAVTTLPRSGPFCSDGCVGYPYTGGAEYVPRDFIWMYPAIVLVLLVVPLAAVLEPTGPTESSAPRVAGPVAVAFAAIAAGLLAADYGIQLAVVQPSLLAGETDGLSIVSQYNPHGIFIALEDVGYVVMSLAFLAMAAVVGRGSRLERAVRWVFLAGGVLTLVLLVLLGAWYGADLEYRFEVYGLAVCWLVLTAAGTMLAVLFGRVDDSANRPRTTTEGSGRRAAHRPLWPTAGRHGYRADRVRPPQGAQVGDYHGRRRCRGNADLLPVLPGTSITARPAGYMPAPFDFPRPNRAHSRRQAPIATRSDVDHGDQPAPSG